MHFDTADSAVAKVALQSISHCCTYLVSSDGQVAVSAAPVLQVSGPEAVTRSHVERSVGLFNHIVGAEQDEESHEDEGGRQYHQLVAPGAL